MCGIVGYIGEKDAQPILLAGLRRLEYRGYDSSGIALILPGKEKIGIRKAPGKISVLEKLVSHKPLSGMVGIAHTRWATHGAPTQANAHPHHDCAGHIAVVHNGIIENYETLKIQLIKEGHIFRSQTDTEVIVHLIEKFYKNITLEEAVSLALKLLVGSFAIGVISTDEPNKLVGARLGSPLIIGVGKGENFLASDVPAVLGFTKEVVFLEENEMVVLDKDHFKISNLEGKTVFRATTHISWDIDQAEKSGFDHFMLKEINEQPGILENLINSRLHKKTGKIFFQEQNIPESQLKDIKNIFIVACGTAYHAGMVAKYVLESLCQVPAQIDVSSEFRYRDLLIGPETLVIAISQSGETADTLAGVGGRESVAGSRWPGGEATRL